LDEGTIAAGIMLSASTFLPSGDRTVKPNPRRDAGWMPAFREVESGKLCE
jgi:hypothetical protein